MAQTMVFISLLLSLITVTPEEPATTLTSGQFQDFGTLALYSLDGWYYRAGGDPVGAFPESTSESWNPVDLAMPPR